VELARPGLDADLFDRRGVDCDHHDLAADRPRLPGEPQVGQRMPKCAVPAALQDDCERNQYENMRPVLLHMVTILVH
jgi:hypothetical protein